MPFAGHTNAKNFVGCSVTANGYIATGSEDNALYCYHRSMPTPITRHCFDEDAAGADRTAGAGPLGGAGGALVGGGAAAAAAAHYRRNENPDANQFLSSVAWCRRGGSCIASNSQGHIKVLQLSA
jgi:protein suppressor of PHYA-105 1